MELCRWFITWVVVNAWMNLQGFAISKMCEQQKERDKRSPRAEMMNDPCYIGESRMNPWLFKDIYPSTFK